MFDFMNMLLFAVFDEQHPLEDSVFFPWCDCIDCIDGFGPEIDLILLICLKTNYVVIFFDQIIDVLKQKQKHCLHISESTSA